MNQKFENGLQTHGNQKSCLKEQAPYAYFLDMVMGIGVQKASKLLQVFGTPREAYMAGESFLQPILGNKIMGNWIQLKKALNPQLGYQKILDQGIRFVPMYDPAYPERLKEIPDKPFALYVIGELPTQDVPAVAVIGARKCSAYGQYQAEQFGMELAAAGIDVVSGLARGIDGISQQAALRAGGKTYAVLGCGVDICYPACHRLLYEDIKIQGGIISSYPPGTQPKANLFPPRNRIISGLADTVLVVEAGQKSGTLITVDMALEQGREIYCIPGRLTDRLSLGCNSLIQQGAGVVLSPSEFIDKVYTDAKCKKVDVSPVSPQVSGPQDRISGLSEIEKEIYQLLDFYPISLDQIRIMMATKKSHGEVSLQETVFTLMKFTLEGLVEQRGGSYLRKG